MARRVAREEGILLGGSSGTCLTAAFRYAASCSQDDMIVALCSDTGRNYLSKMYDDRWMGQNGFLDIAPEKTTAGDLLALLGREEKLIYLRPSDSLQSAAEIFRKFGISQLPIIEDGKMIGAVQEITIVYALHRDLEASKVSLREVMARPMPQVDAGVLLEEVYRILLAGNPAVMVVRDGKLDDLITRADLMEYYERTAK
jgi:cystathionine beta-synthase